MALTQENSGSNPFVTVMTVYRKIQWMDPETKEIIFEDVMTQEDYLVTFSDRHPEYTCDVVIYDNRVTELVNPKEIIVEVTVESPIV